MTATVVLFIVASVGLSALAQIAMKHGMSSPGVQTAISSNETMRLAWSVASSPGVVGGLALYVLSVAFWLSVLARLDVSQAYPFVGLGFLVTMAFGSLFLGEPMSAGRIAGTFMVAFGVLLVARS